jgi:hypothetical protein
MLSRKIAGQGFRKKITKNRENIKNVKSLWICILNIQMQKSNYYLKVLKIQPFATVLPLGKTTLTRKNPVIHSSLYIVALLNTTHVFIPSNITKMLNFHQNFREAKNSNIHFISMVTAILKYTFLY